MKFETKKRKQLEEVKKWLAGARPILEEEVLRSGWCGEIYLLIALEQLVEYLEMTES